MNVAEQISNSALKYPHKRAVVMPRQEGKGFTYSHYTFEQLEERINRFANVLQSNGIKPGQRVLLFVKPSLDFSALCFAIFKLGATVVLIDPGMGIKKLINAIEEVDASSMVAIPIVHYIRRFFPKKFRSVKKYFSVGPAFGAKNILKDLENHSPLFEAYNPSPTDSAAILFTSGGTGRPKGVIYTHDIFIRQTSMLQQEFSLTDQDVDIPGFPLFALFTLAMGMTSCIPLMNPARPAKANPQYLIQNIQDQGATFVAGSPAIWGKVADYCIQHQITLASVRCLVMFGAPIALELHEKFKKILPHGTTFTPYGATECLPVSNISGSQILSTFAERTRKGQGTCIGRALSGLEIKIIEASQGAISDITHTKELSAGEPGEIIVKSDVVTPAYFAHPDKTLLAKIADGNKLWHRMGDIGYLDQDGYLWFCGRAAHTVTTASHKLYPIPVESIYNQHAFVRRSALIGYKVGATIEPGVVIQLKANTWFFSRARKRKIIAELMDLAAVHDHTKDISHFFFNQKFPVDVRHNIKIDRQKLTEWANQGKQL